MRLPSFTRPVTGARTRLVCGATFAFALAAAASVWASFSGAIYTSEADGTRVNQNLYDSKLARVLERRPAEPARFGVA